MHQQTPFAAATREPLSRIHCSSASLAFLRLFTISQALDKNMENQLKSSWPMDNETGPTLGRPPSFNARKQLATVNSCPKVEIVALKLHGSDSLNLGCPSQSCSISIMLNLSMHNAISCIQRCPPTTPGKCEYGMPDGWLESANNDDKVANRCFYVFFP